jgi:hypothetical protein
MVASSRRCESTTTESISRLLLGSSQQCKSDRKVPRVRGSDPMSLHTQGGVTTLTPITAIGSHDGDHYQHGQPQTLFTERVNCEDHTCSGTMASTRGSPFGPALDSASGFPYVLPSSRVVSC